MLMSGPPGAGKSLMASCLPGILPPLLPREALEVSMIHSLAGALPAGGLLRHRPFRNPHHSASQPALIGGGHRVRPGEISLAHHGVLFLDELPEFARGTLEALRQPLETGDALVARANAHIRYPARFQLIAAMNPCRCGYLGDPEQECTKAPRCGADYQNRLSGPLLDRIDMHVDVAAVSALDLQKPGTGEASETVAARVAAARNIQKARYEGFTGVMAGLTNAEASGKVLEAVAPMDSAAKALMNQAVEKGKLSARAYFRILRVARTIADLSGAGEALSRVHIAESLSYRRIVLSSL